MIVFFFVKEKKNIHLVQNPPSQRNALDLFSACVQIPFVGLVPPFGGLCCVLTDVRGTERLVFMGALHAVRLLTHFRVHHDDSTGYISTLNISRLKGIGSLLKSDSFVE